MCVLYYFVGDVVVGEGRNGIKRPYVHVLLLILNACGIAGVDGRMDEQRGGHTESGIWQ